MDSSNKSKILVVGATGYLGMEICRQLAATGRSITALVRKTSAPEKIEALKKMGAVTVEGDLKDSSSIKKSLEGISGVISTASSTISLQPGDTIQSVDEIGQSNLIDAAIAASVKHYVFLSVPSVSIDYPLQTAKQKVEKKLINSMMSFTILRPSYFMEAWLSPMLGFDFPNAKANIYGEGINKISWIAIKDVAAFAVNSLESPAAKNRIIDIGGPEPLSPLEVVALFEKSGGKKFQLQHVPVDALQGQKNAATDDLGKSFAGLMLIYAAGNEVRMTETMKNFPFKLKAVSEYAVQVTQVR